MKTRVAGLLFGIGFGFWLCWAGFTRYEVILGALRFRDPYLWMMFGTAVVTATLGLRLLRRSRATTFLDRQPVTWSPVPVQRAHLVGSAIFGVGWAVAGTCPGPVAAQLGHGQLAALFTGAGIWLGIWLRGRVVARELIDGGEPAAADGAPARAPRPSPGACAEA